MGANNLVKSESVYSATDYQLLRTSVANNIEYFRTLTGKVNSRIAEVFSQFLTNLNLVEVEIKDLSDIVHLYDLDAATPGNGYRSLIIVVGKFVQLSTVLSEDVILKRRNFTFFKKRYVQRVDEYNRLLEGLLALLRISQTLRSKNEPGNLSSYYDDDFVQRIVTDMANVDRTCFYETLNAFQFDESLTKSLRFVSLMVASFSHVYFRSGGKIPLICSAFVGFCRYSHSPSKLSRRFVKVVQNASVDFCKALWNLQGNDIMEKLSKAVTDPLAINKRLTLQPEPLQLSLDDGTLVDIPIPSSHIPVSGVNCRLMSACVREGQLDECEILQHPTHEVQPPSPFLVIHLHGSGYISVSSTIHKVYMNDWALELDVPILSIYNSLAPEAPYPRQLEECFYAYAWAVKNSHHLGSTGEKICLVGCSAGGDLVTCLTVKAIELGIRKPDGVLAVCPTTVTHLLPSPSSILFLMDPLVPLEFGLSCIEGYVGNATQSVGMFANRSLDKPEKSLDVRVVELNKRAGTDDPCKACFLASDDVLAQFPPTRFVSTHLDPVLDYSVTFLKRLKKYGGDVNLDILGNLVHGFLNFALVSQPAQDGSRLCIRRIRELLQMPSHHGIL